MSLDLAAEERQPFRLGQAVPWHSKKLAHCGGFAVAGAPGTFFDNDLGYTFAYAPNSAIVGLWDAFSLAGSGITAGFQSAIDHYSLIYIVSPIDETTDPIPHGQAYLGTIFPFPFAYSDIIRYQRRGTCIDLNTLTLSWKGGEKTQIRSEAQDGSGYFARSTYPVGGVVYHAGGPWPDSYWLGRHVNQALPPKAMRIRTYIDETPAMRYQLTVEPMLHVDDLLDGGLDYATPDFDMDCLGTPPLGSEFDGALLMGPGNNERDSQFFFLCDIPGVWVWDGTRFRCEPVKTWGTPPPTLFDPHPVPEFKLAKKVRCWENPPPAFPGDHPPPKFVDCHCIDDHHSKYDTCYTAVWTGGLPGLDGGAGWDISSCRDFSEVGG